MKTSRLFLRRALLPDSEIRIEGKAAHYLLHVLRVNKGEELILFNGEGGEFTSEILSKERHSLIVKVNSHEEIERESSLVIHLGLAAVKKDKMDLAIQKAVELGVSTITPIISDYTSVKKNLLLKRQDHWQGVIESASEQCGRNKLASLENLTSLKEWVSVISNTRSNDVVKIICHPLADRRTDQKRDQVRDQGADEGTMKECVLLVGPEGGFSEKEVKLAIQSGFNSMQLGSRILRTETAVVAALTLLHAWQGDLGLV